MAEHWLADHCLRDPDVTRLIVCQEHAASIGETLRVQGVTEALRQRARHSCVLSPASAALRCSTSERALKHDVTRRPALARLVAQQLHQSCKPRLASALDIHAQRGWALRPGSQWGKPPQNALERQHDNNVHFELEFEVADAVGASSQ